MRFEFTLALHLGMTVGDMRERMSSAEMQGWIAYSRIEPIGDYRGDLQAGIIASTIANANRGKSSPTRSPSDFMPIYRQQEERKKEMDPLSLSKEIMAHFTAKQKSDK